LRGWSKSRLKTRPVSAQTGGIQALKPLGGSLTGGSLPQKELQLLWREEGVDPEKRTWLPEKKKISSGGNGISHRRKEREPNWPAKAMKTGRNAMKASVEKKKGKKERSKTASKGIEDYMLQRDSFS